MVRSGENRKASEVKISSLEMMIEDITVSISGFLIGLSLAFILGMVFAFFTYQKDLESLMHP